MLSFHVDSICASCSPLADTEALHSALIRSWHIKLPRLRYAMGDGMLGSISGRTG